MMLPQCRSLEQRLLSKKGFGFVRYASAYLYTMPSKSLEARESIVKSVSQALPYYVSTKSWNLTPRSIRES